MNNIKNLSKLKLTLTTTAIQSLIFSIVLLVFMSLALEIAYSKYENKSTTQRIEYANKLFQSNVSERLAIIANLPEFVEFLRSGIVSRNNMKIDILGLITSIKEPSIIGIEVNKNHEGAILKYGLKSPYYVNIPLCYMGMQLENKNGNCNNYSWTLFFSKEKYINSLIQFNDSILKCEKSRCDTYQLLGNKKFGSFYISNQTTMSYPLSVKNNNDNKFIYIEIAFLLILVTLTVISHHKIKIIIDKYISAPLLEITNKLSGNMHIDKQNDWLDEIAYLANQIEVFKSHENDAILGKLSAQVAHDIRSPTAAILMLASGHIALPEEQRLALKNAANRIQDIANNLLNLPAKGPLESPIKFSVFLVSIAILSVIEEKQIQYRKKCISISYDFGKNTFLFIRANMSDFKRAISNLLNNAVEALGNHGTINIKLFSDIRKIYIEIEDNGHGMTDDIKRKILDGRAISNKPNGSGIGLEQVRAFVNNTHGKIEISSLFKKGTLVKLTFEKHERPAWIINELEIYDDAHVVILDDDFSMLAAWKEIFKNNLSTYPRISVTLFSDAKVCLRHINNLLPDMLEKLILITDYELIGQPLNGLDVIEKVKPKHAILVTGHYECERLIAGANLLGVCILPKIILPEISIKINKRPIQIARDIDLVILDNDKNFTEILTYICEVNHKKVDIYNDAQNFINNLNKYNSLNTQFCIDYHLDESLTGVDVAKMLHAKGYTQLYIMSGAPLNREDIPAYLSILPDKIACSKL